MRPAGLLAILMAFSWLTGIHASPNPLDYRRPPPVIRKLKKLYLRTPLVENGRPRAVIVAPEGGGCAVEAKRLSNALRDRTGAALPIEPASAFVDGNWRVDLKKLAGRNVVALGNANDNRLLRALFGMGFVRADSVYPGEGGYVVRTVHDPWAKGVNVVALCGSDSAGVKQAVDVFLKRHARPAGRSLVLPRMIVDVRIKLKPRSFYADPTQGPHKRIPPTQTATYWRGRLTAAGLADKAGRPVRNGSKAAHMGVLLKPITGMGLAYCQTGEAALPLLMKQVLDKNRHLLKKLPPFRPRSMSGRLSGAVRVWDWIEELPVWTDRDRLDITNALLADAARGYERRGFYEQVLKGARQVFDENHGTSSARNVFAAWGYFKKYYDLPASRFWVKAAEACFSGQCSTFQIPEDASGYLNFCPIQSMQYALWSGDTRYFTRGIAQTNAHYVAQASVNNLGLITGFGDSSSLVGPNVGETLGMAAWFYRDPKLYWVIRKKLDKVYGLRLFSYPIGVDLTVRAAEPVEWTGLVKLPIYETPVYRGDSRKTPVYAPKREADPERFNKIVFRENWSADGQYLILDGAGTWGRCLGPHGHKHNDIQTIPNFTALGRMWLVDHDQMRSSFLEHSGAAFFLNGRGGYRKRTLAKLLDFGQTPKWGVTRSLFNRWERAVVWRKGRYFLVLDRTRADRDGEAFGRCIWKGLGEASLKGRDLVLEQKGRYCRILTDGVANVNLEPADMRNLRQWKSYYPHAKPVATYMQLDKMRKLRVGETLGFLSLLYPYASPGAASEVTMRPVSEAAALVTDRGRTALIGVGQVPGTKLIPGVFVLDKDSIQLFGTHLFCEGLVMSDGPCDFVLDLADGTLRVTTKAKNMIALRGVGEVRVDGRRVPLKDHRPPRARPGKAFDLPAGEHTITLKDWGDLDKARAWAKAAFAAAEKDAVRFAEENQRAAVKREVKGLRLDSVKLDSPVETFVTADLNGDGRAEWLVGGPTGVVAYAPTGKRLWAFARKAPCRAVAVGDFNGDGKPEVAVGCDDEKVYLLDNAGRELWSYRCKPSKGSLDLPPKVDRVWIVDLDGDGPKEVVAGANWVHVLDGAGKLKWEKFMQRRRGRICGDFMCGDIADMDGDGKQEIAVGYSTSYPLTYVYNAKGKQVWPRYDGPPSDLQPGRTTGLQRGAAILDVFGKGGLKQVVVASKALFLVYPGDQAARVRDGRYYYHASSNVALAWLQPDPKRPARIFTATDITGVNAHGRWWWWGKEKKDSVRGKVLWTRTLGERASALAAMKTAKGGRVLVGTKPGNVFVLSADSGKTIGLARLNGAPIRSFVVGETGEVLAPAADGTVLRIRLE